MAEQEQPTQCRTRQEKAVRWAGSHAAELTGVGAPLAGGLIWSPWLALLSAAGTVAWVAGEWRLRHTTRTARTTITGDPRALTATVHTEQAGSDHTGSDHTARSASTTRREAKA